MHSHIICICIRVAAIAVEVIYEVVAEPQEPQGQAPQQEERLENQAQDPVDPGTEQQTQGKPRCTSHYLKIMTPIYVSIICALGLGIVWNPSCMIPRISRVILVCIGR